MTSSVPDTGVWLEAEIARARRLLDEGDAEGSVQLLADAERVAAAQDFPLLLVEVSELAGRIASRSEGSTRRRAQRVVSRIEHRSQMEVAASQPPPPRPASAPVPPKTSRLLIRLAAVVIAASVVLPLLALVLDSESLYSWVFAAGYLGVTWLVPGILIGLARQSWRAGLAATLAVLVGWSIVMTLIGMKLGVDLS